MEYAGNYFPMRNEGCFGSLYTKIAIAPRNSNNLNRHMVRQYEQTRKLIIYDYLKSWSDFCALIWLQNAQDVISPADAHHVNRLGF